MHLPVLKSDLVQVVTPVGRAEMEGMMGMRKRKGSVDVLDVGGRRVVDMVD